MARFWIERYDQAKHRSHMPGAPDASHNNLVSRQVFFVRACSFTFEFHSVAQIRTCLAYFDRKIHPSSIIPAEELGRWGGDQGETQRWFERLAQWLFEEPKRRKVVNALSQAICQFSSDDASKNV